MGLMRFRVFPPDRLTDEFVRQSYLVGMDHISWPVRAAVADDVLSIYRTASDSAAFCTPWPVAGRGVLSLSSGTLAENDEPYFLPLELARGTVNALRSQLFEWQTIGLVAPEQLIAKTNEATDLLAAAAVRRDELAVCAEYAEKAIRTAFEAADRLVELYVEQAFWVRKRAAGRLAAHLGINLGTTSLDPQIFKQCARGFSCAVAPFSWKAIETDEGHFDWTATDEQIERCRQANMKIVGGPVLNWDHSSLPDWLTLWDDDFDGLLDCASQYVKTTVERYREKVDYWICAGRLNTGDALGLSEEEKLQLAVRAIETVRNADPETPTMISVDQPWAEYMSRRNVDFAPLHYADALLRAGMGIAGVVLETNVGFAIDGTLPRHPLEWSRYLDAWSSLGVPIWISLCVPSSTEADPLAARNYALPCGPAWNPNLQQDWINRLVPLLFAKPWVSGVIWNQLHDGLPHDFPNGGIIDADNRLKLVFRSLLAVKRSLTGT